MSHVVVTGMGLVSSAGFTLDSFWKILSEGKITYGLIPEYQNNASYRIKIGARMKSDEWLNTAPPSDSPRHYGKAALYSVCSAIKAVERRKPYPKGRR